MKRRLFKIIVDDNVDTIVSIYVFDTLKTLFTIIALILSFIQFVLYLTKIHTNVSNLAINLGIMISSILILIMNLLYSKYRKIFIKQLETSNDDKEINNKFVKKDKYRCP